MSDHFFLFFLFFLLFLSFDPSLILYPLSLHASQQCMLDASFPQLHLRHCCSCLLSPSRISSIVPHCASMQGCCVYHPLTDPGANCRPLRASHGLGAMGSCQLPQISGGSRYLRLPAMWRRQGLMHGGRARVGEGKVWQGEG